MLNFGVMQSKVTVILDQNRSQNAFQRDNSTTVLWRRPRAGNRKRANLLAGSLARVFPGSV